MRKNQKYSKEEMYLAIELWQKTGLSQDKFCSREKTEIVHILVTKTSDNI